MYPLYLIVEVAVICRNSDKHSICMEFLALPLPWQTVIVGLTLNDLAERMHVDNALQLHDLFLGRAIGAVFGISAVFVSRKERPVGFSQ